MPVRSDTKKTVRRSGFAGGSEPGLPFVIRAVTPAERGQTPRSSHFHPARDEVGAHRSAQAYTRAKRRIRACRRVRGESTSIASPPASRSRRSGRRKPLDDILVRPDGSRTARRPPRGSSRSRRSAPSRGRQSLETRCEIARKTPYLATCPALDEEAVRICVRRSPLAGDGRRAPSHPL